MKKESEGQLITIREVQTTSSITGGNNEPIQRVKNIMGVMGRVNDIVGFPMTVGQIRRWSERLNKLRPDVRREKLEFLFECYELGALTWEKEKGIQNIFEGLNKIRETYYEYTLIESTPG